MFAWLFRYKNKINFYRSYIFIIFYFIKCFLYGGERLNIFNFCIFINLFAQMLTDVLLKFFFLHQFSFTHWGLNSSLLASVNFSPYISSRWVILNPHLSFIWRHKFKSISQISRPSEFRPSPKVRDPSGAAT